MVNTWAMACDGNGTRPRRTRPSFGSCDESSPTQGRPQLEVPMSHRVAARQRRSDHHDDLAGRVAALE